MQNDHITLDRLICGIVLNGEGVDRCIEIIVVVEVCHQILQTLIGCVIRNAVCLVAQNHTVGQLLMLIILTVIHHLHADTGLGFHLHNKQNVILFLGFTREAVQLLVCILQEHIVLCVFLDVSGDGFHLVKHVIGFGFALQTVEHGSNSAVVFIQISVQFVKLTLQLVVFLLQLILLCLRLGDQAAHRHGLGNDLTLLVLLGHRSGRALHVGNFLLHFSNTQLLQLMIDHTHGKIHCLQALIGRVRILDDLRKVNGAVTGVRHQLGDITVGNAQLLDLSRNRNAFGTQRIFLVLKCAQHHVAQFLVHVHTGKDVGNHGTEFHAVLQTLIRQNVVCLLDGTVNQQHRAQKQHRADDDEQCGKHGLEQQSEHLTHGRFCAILALLIFVMIHYALPSLLNFL